jgi:hypothetical protein
MDTAVEVVVFIFGALLVFLALGSAVRTVVLPRGIPAKLATVVFLVVRFIFRVRLGRAPSYERRDRVMALYAPLSLLILAATWLVVVATGFIAMFWSLDGEHLRYAAELSGSSLTTLGFVHPSDIPKLVLSFAEAGFGLTLLALLITYLPSLYGAFSRREASVSHLEVRAGSPPWGPVILERYSRINWMGGLEALWDKWEGWFIEIAETHTSFPALVFFRSPVPHHSWPTAAGAVLDAASLASSTLVEHDADAELLIRAGYVSLRRVADFFDVPYDPDPRPDDPISVAREEFDEAYDRLASSGVDVKPDRDQAWRDFAGWRVNYDTVLVTLCTLVQAPYAPWSSDRSIPRFRVKVLGRKGVGANRTQRVPDQPR